MPHVIVKLLPGKSEHQKKRLTDAITKDVIEILHYGEESVSVALEEVEAQDWAERVFKPDIQNQSEGSGTRRGRQRDFRAGRQDRLA